MRIINVLENRSDCELNKFHCGNDAVHFFSEIAAGLDLSTKHVGALAVIDSLRSLVLHLATARTLKAIPAPGLSQKGCANDEDSGWRRAVTTVLPGSGRS
jgi:hypothetical protein